MDSRIIRRLAWSLSAPKAAALRRPSPQGGGETLGAARRLFLMCRARQLIFALGIGLLAGCANLPSQVVRVPTEAIPASAGTVLGRIALASSPDDALSGFRLLPTGPFALDTRLTLVRRAERSIDLQYYLIQDDDTGRYLLRALRDAALRGVRVRLLIDDLYTAGSDPLLLGLAAHPNVEVRLFNPFPGGRDHFLTRFLRSASDFSRVNRRMHNKLFIVDGAMAVAGGRNIANEYFMRHAQANFVDLDTFITGAVVPQLQRLFDSYWNSPVVFPLRSIVATPFDAQELQAQFEAITGPGLTTPPEPTPSTDVLGYGPIADDLDAGRLGLVWATAEAFADPPAQIRGMDTSYGLVPLLDVDSVRYNVGDMVRGARTEVVITSPYLIPGERGMALIESLRKRGVHVKMLTNSLAATDEPLVHIGYRKYRREMLKLGVELYELSPVRVKRTPRLGMFATSQGRLHAKTTVVDRRRIFIGSMNFDPRSDKLNTEMGVIIDSPQLAREMLRLMDLDKLQASYRVSLSPDGQGLRWMAADDDGEVVFDDEPDADLGTKILLELLGPLAPEELL